MNGPELVVFGCLTLDNVITAAADVLPQSYGGNCLYAALGARLWSDRVGIVSRAGRDFPDAMFELLEDKGIAAQGIVRLDVPHGRNMAFAYRADGSRTRAIPEELLARVPAAERARFVDTTLLPDAHRRWLDFAPSAVDVPEAWWRSAYGMHDAYMPVERHREIAGAARARAGRRIWLQIDSPWRDERDAALADPRTLYAEVDALLPSEADVEVYRPGVSCAQTIAAMLADGAPRIVLKRGSSGCAVYARGAGLVAEIPAARIEAVDPTGAGDAFCGGFLAGIVRTYDVLRAARCGTVAASFAVESPGIARLATATRDEAEVRLASLVAQSTARAV
jgi:ribokinase